MKYICSNFPNAKISSWVEEDIKDEKHFIECYFNREIKIWDADNCGEEEFFFAFSSGKCFKLIYNWWIDGSSDAWLADEFEIKEIIWEECKDHISSDRDWLKI